MTVWADPRTAVSLALIGLFAFAYVSNPADELMKGALIAGFSAGYGYWLGSSRGSAVKSRQLEQLVTPSDQHKGG
jgi:hypothetical protein